MKRIMMVGAMLAALVFGAASTSQAYVYVRPGPRLAYGPRAFGPGYYRPYYRPGYYGPRPFGPGYGRAYYGYRGWGPGYGGPGFYGPRVGIGFGMY